MRDPSLGNGADDLSTEPVAGGGGQSSSGESGSRESVVGVSAGPADGGGQGGGGGVRLRRSSGTGTRSLLDQLMPVILFIVLYNLVNTEVAVIAATGWSVKVVVSRRRRGEPVGLWLPCVTVYLIVRAAVSVAVDRGLLDFGVSSEAVYFGIGIATKMLIGLALAVTILMGRPFALRAVDWVVSCPEDMRSHPIFFSAMRNVTWGIVFYEVGSSVWDAWLFNNTGGVNMFLIGRQGVNLVVTFVMIFAGLLYLDRKLSRLPDWPGIAELMESAQEAQPPPARGESGDP